MSRTLTAARETPNIESRATHPPHPITATAIIGGIGGTFGKTMLRRLHGTNLTAF